MSTTPENPEELEVDDLDIYEEETPIVETPEETPETLETPEATETPAPEATPEKTENSESSETPEDGPMTPAAIAKAVREAMEESRSVPEEEPEKELTQEEIDAYLKTAKYTSDDLKALGLIDDDMEAEAADARTAQFNELQQRIVQQAVATSQMLMQHQAGQLRQQIDPVVSSYQQQQQAAMVGAFYEKYESLKDYEEIVKIAAGNAVQEKKLEGKSFDEVSQIIATDAAAMVKKFSGVDIPISATTKSPQTKPAVKTEHSVKPAGQAAGGRSQQQTSQAKQSNGAGEFDIYED